MYGSISLAQIMSSSCGCFIKHMFIKRLPSNHTKCVVKLGADVIDAPRFYMTVINHVLLLLEIDIGTWRPKPERHRSSPDFFAKFARHCGVRKAMSAYNAKKMTCSHAF